MTAAQTAPGVDELLDKIGMCRAILRAIDRADLLLSPSLPDSREAKDDWEAGHFLLRLLGGVLDDAATQSTETN